MSDIRQGPLVTTTTTASCKGCAYLKPEYYHRCEDGGDDYDWGFDYYCTEPQAVASVALGHGRRFIAQNPKTPAWCPLLVKLSPETTERVEGALAFMASGYKRVGYVQKEP